jgi:hypothetical protein
VTALADGLRGFVEVADLVAGAAIDAPDFDIELFAPAPAPARSAIDDIAVVDGAFFFSLSANLAQAGSYDLTVTSSSAGWTIDPSAATFTVATPNSRRNFQIMVTPDALPPPATTLTVRVQRQGSAKSRTLRERIFPVE